MRRSRLSFAAVRVGLVVVLLSGAACTRQQGFTENSRMSTAARSYLSSALAVMEQNSLFRHEIDWGQLRRRAFEQAGGAQKTARTYEAIITAINTMGDEHSVFWDQQARERLPPAASFERVVELRDLAVDIAYNLVTGCPSEALREATESDGLIAVTPVFSASYSGLFTSFFDVIENTAPIGTPCSSVRPAARLDTRSPWNTCCARSSPSSSRSWYPPRCTPPPRTGAETVTRSPTLPQRIARAAGELAGQLGGRPAAAVSAPDPVIPFEQQLAALRPD